jgi:hypothetical protein
MSQAITATARIVALAKLERMVILVGHIVGSLSIANLLH